ncbi:hypothetical protein CR194_06160 [Salipaludibacillus keqinensis]|uniref:Uncharacterized protein n=1 Tax=Salipaludibacillus keqinensis TaxID=2045207 RepID=A0A323TZR8_9BACI|nr:aromatic acid exporter family protein [Salipaludibacillus keqinensis]PYZ95095.1 hypothetical protein CR194_06160 [Salipaludibacillus keqinensis]
MKVKTPKKPWIGGRVLKTGIAVFITSLICLALDLPAIFAVITAIVTIEPTTHDSIRKGIIRFPASAIGAGLAASTVYFFGESPLTYTLAATLTIILCQKLKLYDGTLVAALTSVAMIPDLQDYLFLSFLIRLGTTSIGITVSTLVNVLILPADYLDNIERRNHQHLLQMKNTLYESLNRLLNVSPQDKKNHLSYEVMQRELAKTDQLLHYQRKELRYHRFKFKKYKHYITLMKTMTFLQRAILHLGNLQYLPRKMIFSEYEQLLLTRAKTEFNQLLDNMDKPMEDSYFQFIDELNQHLRYEFSYSRSSPRLQLHEYQLSGKVILFYELLAIHDLLEDLHHHILTIRQKERNGQ